MSVFKRTYKDKKTGKQKKLKVFTVEFIDHNKVTRRINAFSDRVASEELERNLNRLVALRMANIGMDADMTRVFECLPNEIRERLAEWKLIDKQRAAAGKPLDEHIAEWLDSLKSKCRTDKHRREFESKVKAICKRFDYTHITDIATTDMNTYINESREANAAPSTINNYIRAMKGFCIWLETEKRLTENPMKRYPLLNTKTDRRHVRRRLTIDQLQHFMIVTYNGKKHHGLTGKQRYLLYLTASTTGLRFSELRSRERQSFDFTAMPPTVFIEADESKNRQEALLPLRADIAAMLAEYMTDFKPTDKAFPGMWGDKGSLMVKQDLEAAGLPYCLIRTRRGRSSTFIAFVGSSPLY